MVYFLEMLVLVSPFDFKCSITSIHLLLLSYYFLYSTMKKNTFLPILFTLTSILQSCEDNTLYFEDAYVIENVNLIDPLEGIEEKQTVVIKENKIHQIYNTAEVILSSKNKIYDGTNQFLIPGLWDAHIHFAFETILGEYMPDLFLSNGITRVREIGRAHV